MAFVPCPGIVKVSQQGGHPILQYRLPNQNSDLLYEFCCKNVNKDGSHLYVCCACRAMYDRRKAAMLPPAARGRPASVKVIAGVFQSDPENTTSPHICAGPINAPSADGRRETISFLKKIEEDKDTRSPVLLSHDLSQTVNKPEHQHYSAAQKHQMIRQLSGGSGDNTDSVRRALQRHKIQKSDALIPGQLPDDLFKCAADGEVMKMIDDGELLVIGSRMTLQAVFTSMAPDPITPVALMVDGRFKQVPSKYQFGKSSQVYTVSVVLASGHCLPLMVAILKDATEATYTKLFE